MISKIAVVIVNWNKKKDVLDLVHDLLNVSEPALDIFVPEFVNESEIENFLADICHEWATEKNHSVRRLE